MRGLYVQVVGILLVRISLTGVIGMRFGILTVGLSRSLLLRSLLLCLSERASVVSLLIFSLPCGSMG